MSTNPNVAIGFGYALDAKDPELLNKMKVLFSDFAKNFTDADGNLTDPAFLTELQYASDFRQRYKVLDFGVIESLQESPEKVIVYRIGSVQKLYAKYDGGITPGVVLPAELSYSEDGFEAFAKDFGLSTQPQQMIWSYWS
jgi:hypothetical protein